MSDWCTIESDPGVFTELIESLGVQGVEVNEVWSLDDVTLGASFSNLPVYGLIFLFKWQKNHSTEIRGETPLTAQDIPPSVFFAHQRTTNACATQAILSILLNHLQDINVGPTLRDFHSFTSSFPPDLLGDAIGASDDIRTAHNNFARKDAFALEDGSKKRIATDDDDVFHFIAYVPQNGTVYELDGLQKGPIVVGNYETSNDTNPSTNDKEENKNKESTTTPSSLSSSLDWLKVARTAIQKRMELYASTEIKFNLMAVTQDRRIPIQNALAAQAASSSDTATSSETASSTLQAELAMEESKRHDWKIENERRQHNYLPLCIELFKAIASKGNLPQLATQARERNMQQRAKLMEFQRQQQETKEQDN
mmetsp:Transcript_23279/g.32615  ORF Transcript_23279/g.32615 Transcript_23279/m.32615 type:complete len:367 (+) Transcript_23279:35-1135(+)